MNHYRVTNEAIKNGMKVAKHENCLTEVFSYKITNKERDIFIKCSFCPILNKENDEYPYFLLEMKEEEFQRKEYFSKWQMKEMKDITNAFLAQGSESFLENYIPNY